MGLVQAKMSFYHDSVGSRAHNEIFEIQNEQVCAELEQMGYVTKVSQEQEQAHQEFKTKQQEVVKNYLHVYHDEDDKLITAILQAAKSFVRNYTGLSGEKPNISDDLYVAVFILSAELYDNRVYTVDNTDVNPVIQTILDMHSVNLL